MSSKRHHYIPKFYLKKWANVYGKICEYSRPKSIVKPQTKHYSSSGYIDFLYSDFFAESGREHDLEDRYMKILDQIASDALDFLLGGAVSNMTPRLRSGWTRFLISLKQRNPQKIDEIKKKWFDDFDENLTKTMIESRSELEKFGINDKKALLDSIDHEKMRKRGIIALPKIINLQKAGRHINSMVWKLYHVGESRHVLLTSDRPVFFSNGLLKPDSHIILPLAPGILFVAANSIEFHQKLENFSPDKIVKESNKIVVSNAEKYVYSTSDKQLRFVENHMPRRSLQGH